MDLPFLLLATVGSLSVFGAAWSLLVWSHVEGQVFACWLRKGQSVIRSFLALLLYCVLLDSFLFAQFRDALLGSTCRGLWLFSYNLCPSCVGIGSGLWYISRNCFGIQIIQAWALLFMQFLVGPSIIWSPVWLVIIWLSRFKQLVWSENFLGCRSWVTTFEHSSTVFILLIQFAWSPITSFILCSTSFLFAWLRNWITSLTDWWPSLWRTEVLRYWSLRASYSWLVSFQPQLHGRWLDSSSSDHFLLRVWSLMLTLIFLWLGLTRFFRLSLIVIARGSINITLHIYNKSNYYYSIITLQN